MNKSIMCHVVAGYPNRTDCLKLLLGMQARGVSSVEIQIPFSDPIADGDAIMEANDVALQSGMTTKRSFELIKTARAQGLTIDVYIMSYVQKIQHFGFELFCQQAAACHVKGFIVPDLPYDSKEHALLKRFAKKLSLEIIPVVSPGMDAQRLQAILATSPSILYLTSKRGITGSRYASSEELKRIATVIKKQSSVQLLIGFGIQTPDDVRNALKIGNVAIVGSAVIRSLQSTTLPKTLNYIESLVDDQGQQAERVLV